MTTDYPVLTYPGDVTSSEEAQPGQLLGWDETFRPYEVIDTEFNRHEPYKPGSSICPTCGRTLEYEGHTHVFLQYAQPDTMKEQGEAFILQMRLRGLL